ncbi:MAG: transaldolase family protein [Thermodesulfobacteriota bacterium]|nr:transaldolase family protein [Thermodesulfobacteriota bacterium]
MEAPERLHSTGQSLWMDHVDREQICNGSLIQYIKEGAITGLSLSPQAICHSISNSTVYDDGICKKLDNSLYGEALVVDLILEDIHHAADPLKYVFDRTDGVDGWATLPISPLLTSDPGTLLQSVSVLHTRVNRANVLIMVPGLPDMLGPIEEIVFAGVPINITFIYSCNQFLNTAEACLRGIKRRIALGLKPTVPVFISIPISHLAAALAKEIKQEAATRASIDIARSIYKTMRMLHTSQQWERAYNVGARPLRLVWVSSDDESAAVSDISLYNYLAAPFTVVTMSERTMGAFFDHGHPEALLPYDGYDYEENVAGHQKAGRNFKHLADSLQEKAAAWQVKTWITLLDTVARKSASCTHVEPIDQ